MKKDELKKRGGERANSGRKKIADKKENRK